MAKERTQEQQDIIDKMDQAAKEAKEVLTLMKNGGAATMESVVQWWKDWYPKAGHKRLGRILASM